MLRILRPLLPMTIVLTVQGCQSSPPEEISVADHSRLANIKHATSYNDIAEDYTSITGPSAQTRPVNLKELIHFYPEGGLYHVDRLEGRCEDVELGSERCSAFTYVTMTLVKAWTSRAPGHFVARITGGPVQGGAHEAWHVELKLGESVGAMVDPPRPGNRGYYSLDPIALFRVGAHGGFTNGQLFTRRVVSDVELGQLIGRASQATSQDEAPDYGSSATVSADGGTSLDGDLLYGVPVDLGVGKARIPGGSASAPDAAVSALDASQP